MSGRGAEVGVVAGAPDDTGTGDAGGTARVRAPGGSPAPGGATPAVAGVAAAGDAAAAGPGQGRGHGGGDGRLSGRAAGRLGLGAAVLPFVVSAVVVMAGVDGDFRPFADLALTELVTRDVGRHEVLVGPFSRDGWHHPGPVFFYLLAVPYRLLGSSSSALSVGALAINGASVAGMAAVARRRGGLPAMLCMLLACGLLVRALGFGEAVTIPWNPFVTVLPYGLLVMLTWAMAAGERWALPVATVVTTFLVQTHVGYAALALPLLAAGTLALVVATVRPPGRARPLSGAAADPGGLGDGTAGPGEVGAGGGGTVDGGPPLAGGAAGAGAVDGGPAFVGGVAGSVEGVGGGGAGTGAVDAAGASAGGVDGGPAFVGGVAGSVEGVGGGGAGAGAVDAAGASAGGVDGGPAFVGGVVGSVEGVGGVAGSVEGVGGGAAETGAAGGGAAVGAGSVAGAVDGSPTPAGAVDDEWTGGEAGAGTVDVAAVADGGRAVDEGTRGEAAGSVHDRAVDGRRRGRGRGRRSSPGWRLAGAGGLAAVAAAVLWLPAVVQQVTSEPGNLGVVVRWFRENSGESRTVGDGWRAVTAQYGLPPEWLAGQAPTTSFYEPRYMNDPLVPVVLLVVAVAAMAGWRRPGPESRRLLGVWLVASLAGVVAVARTVGAVFAYRLGWAWVLGAIAGAHALWVGWAWVAHRWPRSERRLLVPGALAALLLVTAVDVSAAVRAGSPGQPHSALFDELETEVRRELPAGDGPVTVQPTSYGAVGWSTGMVLALERDGVDARFGIRDAAAGEHRQRPDGPLRAGLLVVTDEGIVESAERPDLELVAYAGDVGLEELTRQVRRGEDPAPADLLVAAFRVRP